MLTTKNNNDNGPPNHCRRLSGIRFLVTLTLALTCFTFAFSTSRAAKPQARPSSSDVVTRLPLTTSMRHPQQQLQQPLSTSSSTPRSKYSFYHDRSTAVTSAISTSSSLRLSQRETPSSSQQQQQSEPKVDKVLMMSASSSSDETDKQGSSSYEEGSSLSSQISIAEVSTDTADMVDNSRRNRRIQIAAVAIGALGTLSAAAHYGILMGPPLSGLVGGGFGPYTDSMILRDAASTALTAILAVVFVKAVTYGYEQNWYSSKVGRKLNHTLAAPLFILFFPLFSSADGARFFAGLVTTTNILRLYLAGTGAGETSLAKTVSRSGDKAEVLKGPFIYVCLFQLCIWFFWRSSPIGVVAMSTMAAGDGMADLVGRRWGKTNPWPFVADNKSMVGTAAFALSAFVCSFGLLSWLATTGCLELSMGTADLAVRVLFISVVCAFVELIPVGDDNFTVPFTAGALAALLLQ